MKAPGTLRLRALQKLWNWTSAAAQLNERAFHMLP